MQGRPPHWLGLNVMRSSWRIRRTQVASPVPQARLLGSEQKDQEEKGEGGAHGWRDGTEAGKCFRQRTTVEAYTETAPPESSALAHLTDENPPAGPAEPPLAVTGGSRRRCDVLRGGLLKRASEG